MDNKITLTNIERDLFFMQIFLGLYYLHIKHIIHNDLKPSNIFITEIKLEGIEEPIRILKIGDFGISKSFDQMKRTDSLAGKTTVAYKAPEVIAEQPSTSKVDIWALGIISY